MVEQFKTERFAQDAEDFARLQPQAIQIDDTGLADSLNLINHQLNRIPRGIRIVNTAIASPGPLTWYRLNTDDPWSDRLITIRFWGTDHARVLLEVF